MTRVRCLALALLLLPSIASAQAPRRAVFLPTANTVPSGGFDVTLYDIALPGVAYGATDRLQVGFAATRIPTAEWLVFPGAKYELARAEGISIAAFGGLGIEAPEAGSVGYLPMLGIAASATGERTCVTFAVIQASPTSIRGTDRVLSVATSVVWRASRRVELVAEEHLRVVAPEAQVASTTIAAARAHLGRFSIDAGWMLDLGIVGPPFPLIGPEGVLGVPGVPVVNVGASF